MNTIHCSQASMLLLCALLGGQAAAQEDKLAVAVGRVFAKIGETAGGKGQIPKAAIDSKKTALAAPQWKPAS